MGHLAGHVPPTNHMKFFMDSVSDGLGKNPYGIVGVQAACSLTQDECWQGAFSARPDVAMAIDGGEDYFRAIASSSVDNCRDAFHRARDWLSFLFAAKKLHPRSHHFTHGWFGFFRFPLETGPGGHFRSATFHRMDGVCGARDVKQRHGRQETRGWGKSKQTSCE